MTELENHREFAENLRRAAVAGGAETNPSLRQAALARAANGVPLAEPYDALIGRIIGASSRVTDDQVAAVRQSAGSDKAAFEVLMAAAIGAGLLRWDKAMEALDAAS